jgi:hypothetical protein
MPIRRKKKSKDLLDKHVSSGLTAEDKLKLKKYRDELKTSYAQLIRDALYETYPFVFRN